jgi:hypothetical protein
MIAADLQVALGPKTVAIVTTAPIVAPPIELVGIRLVGGSAAMPQLVMML